MPDRTVPPAHPWAEVQVETRLHPALIIEWVKKADAHGYYSWHARCLMWINDEPVVSLVPAVRVKRAG